VITFKLHNPSARRSGIDIVVSIAARQYRRSTHLSVLVAEWNQKKSCCRSIADRPDLDVINSRLSDLSDSAIKILRSYSDRPLPSQSEFFSLLNKTGVDEAQPSITFTDYIDKLSKTKINPHTGYSYLYLNHLLDEFLHGKKLLFSQLNSDFFHKFEKWYFDKSNAQNSFHQVITILKCAYNAAYRDKIITEKIEFIKVPSKPIDKIYLTLAEIDKFQNCHTEDFQFPATYNGHVIKQTIKKSAQNIFVVQCYTGLRFSDVIRLQPSNIQNGTIRITTKKTSTPIVIPVHPKIAGIIGNPDFFDNINIDYSVYNFVIKYIAKFSGIVDEISIYAYPGGVQKRIIKHKYELVTTHTPRRSFATNAFKSGISAISIMRITGHTTQQSFMRYIRIDNEENAEMLMNSNFFKNVPVTSQ
jgi:integrase